MFSLRKINNLYKLYNNLYLLNARNLSYLGTINHFDHGNSIKSADEIRRHFHVLKSYDCSLLEWKSLTLNQKRFKKGKKGRRQERVEEEEESEDEDEEVDELEGADPKLGYQDINTTINSMRLDAVAKAGLGFPRAKIEEMFYDGRLRVNGERISKKSELLKEGDEIDAILGLNVENSEMLDVVRCQILKVDDKASSTGRAKVMLRKHGKMVINNYSDPYTGLRFNVKKES